MNNPEFEHFHVEGNGQRFHCAAAGPGDAPLIICLHGFPEFWAAWSAVMEELAGEFRLVAPDQRGFNLSSRPEGVENYRTSHLVADLAAIADALSPERPYVLAGHDWGASVAYAYAFAHPRRLSHLVVANGVHPWCFQNAILHDPAQRRASQYINRLRAPESDQAMAEDGFRRTLRMLAGFSRTDWMNETDRQAYLEAWGQPGALPAMLNWYRATPLLVPPVDAPSPTAPILGLPAETMMVRVPHLLVWGEGDEALRPSTIDGLERFAPDLTVKRFAGTGHWILHERPVEVADAVRAFLGT